MRSRPTITHLIIMGDSLTDRGTLAERKIAFCIPLGDIAGLKGVSPQGSFTNGYPWSDHYLAAIASEFTIKQLALKNRLDTTDIADGVIDKDLKIRPAVQHYYDLNNSLYVNYKNKPFARVYAEGGLGAHNYRYDFTFNPKLFFTRLILRTLKEKREDLFAHDVETALPPDIKEKTLLIEWTGANDLMVLNEKPTQAEVDKAVADRFNNIKQLIAHGYKHFVLFTLPDLSLTPRFQQQSKDEQTNAQRCVLNFNSAIASGAQKLMKLYKDCSVDVFDVNTLFTDLVLHPEKYGFDPAKRSQPYITSPDFIMNKKGLSPANGYIFWDDVHPTADVHALLAYQFCDMTWGKFNFTAPENTTIKRSASHQQLHEPYYEQHGFFRHRQKPPTDCLSKEECIAQWKGKSATRG